MLTLCALILALWPGQFSHGVAAGDVTDRTALLWTRADAPGQIAVELAGDPGFERSLVSGIVNATEEHDSTLTLALSGLQPATPYYYRFRRLDLPASASRTGRFRTAPDPAAPESFRFLFSGDTNFAFAPFVAMGAAAEEDADFAIWFGDTIYADVPSGGLGVATTRDEYRAKYRQVRSDANVQELSASMAIWIGWDDHEVTNDYAGRDPTLDPAQRNAAYDAFFEYSPVSRASASEFDPYRTYRSFRYGSTAEFFLLDERQYRDVSAREACGANPDPLGFSLGLFTLDNACRDLLATPRDMLGPAQFDWLKAGLRRSTARVKFIVNNVPLTHVGILPYDRWDGYDAQRRELLEFIDAERIDDVIFLTTDIHSNALNPDVSYYFRNHRRDYRLPNRTRTAEIIVGPWGNQTLRSELLKHAAELANLPDSRIFSDLLGSLEDRLVRKIQSLNGLPFIEDDRRTYAVVEVTSEGSVNVTFRAVREGAVDAEGGLVTESLYSAPVEAPAPTPCGSPLLALVAMTLLSFSRVGIDGVAARWRRRSSAVTSPHQNVRLR